MNRLKKIANAEQFTVRVIVEQHNFDKFNEEVKQISSFTSMVQETTATRLKKRLIHAANWLKVDWSLIIKGYDKQKNDVVNLVSYYPYDSNDTAFIAKDKLSDTYYAVPSDYVGQGAGDESRVRSFPNFSTAENYILGSNNSVIEHREITNEGHQDGEVNDEVWKAYEFQNQQRIFMDKNEGSDYVEQSFSEYQTQNKPKDVSQPEIPVVQNEEPTAEEVKNEEAVPPAIEPTVEPATEETPKPKKKKKKKKEVALTELKYDITFNVNDEAQKVEVIKQLDELVSTSIIKKWEEMVVTE